MRHAIDLHMHKSCMHVAARVLYSCTCAFIIDRNLSGSTANKLFIIAVHQSIV